jgi:NAD(P)-dependent dehydrogenase (short-subunit alcohol dehydrogenase family)
MSDRPTALVTGGAGDIAYAFGEALARSGMRVVLADCRAEAAHAAAARLAAATGTPVEGWELDVADGLSWTSAVDRLEREGHRLSLLVHCAGVLLAGRLADCDPAELARVIGVNLLGPIVGTQAAIPLLRRNAAGSTPLPAGVICVASIFASIAPPGFAAYSASKAGLVALGETLGIELAPLGLRVTTVLPGVVPTGLFGGAHYADETHRKAVEAYLDRTELTPAMVAERALAAYRKGHGVVPIGARATRYWWLKRLFPRLLTAAVARQSKRLNEASVQEPEA